MDQSHLTRRKTPEEVEIEEMMASVNEAIQALRGRLKDKDQVKAAVTDLLKLLQLRKELEEERPRHISVRWIDECKTSGD